MPNTYTHYRACNLCEAICGLEIQIVDGKVGAIKGDPNDPLSRGHICPKAVALKDVYEDPDRLRRPVRRTASGWEEIGWDEAFDAVAAGFRRVQAQYGNDAVGVYLGNPNVHNLGSLLFGPGLVRSLRTRNRFSATSVDQLPHHVASLFLFGHFLLIPVPDIDRTDYMLILGANPLVSNGSLMTAPGMAQRLRAIQERGGRFVVVDPRRTETAERADEHLAIRPGSDALLLLAMIHTLFEENLVRLGHLEAFTDGVDEVARIARDFAPEVVASHTGISAAHIRRLTRDFAGALSAVAYGRMGLSTQAFGGLCQWLIPVLNILTGNFDRPGGAMFTRPAVDIVGQQGSAGKRGSFGRWKSRVNDRPEFIGELPVSELATEILTPGEGQIRGMLTVAGNPILSTPNGRRLDEAFQELEFMASIDLYINETTRHAHIILPPTTGLEIEHYDVTFHLFAVRNTAKYSAPMVDRSPDQRHDWEIAQALAERLSGKPAGDLTPEMMLRMGIQFGPYAAEGLTFDQIRDHPHGVDLGPLQPCLPERLLTPEKRIHLTPAPIVSDLPRLRQAMDARTETAENGKGVAERAALLLIGRRELRSNNSWMHNSARLVKGRPRCTVLVHPDDAAPRGIADGQSVTVTSEVGSVTLPAELTTGILPGVISIPHGYGHDREGVSLTVAQHHAGSSVNDLTDHRLLDELTGNAALNGVPVRLEVEE